MAIIVMILFVVALALLAIWSLGMGYAIGHREGTHSGHRAGYLDGYKIGAAYRDRLRLYSQDDAPVSPDEQRAFLDILSHWGDDFPRKS